MSKTIPPFYENFDSSHCFQCCLRGVLEYFNPEKMWTWQELEELTGKRPGLYTWLFKTCSELPDIGYEVVVISDLNISAFAIDPEKEIHKFYSEEGAKNQIKNTALEDEQKYAKAMLSKVDSITLKERSYTVEDIEQLIADGYLIIPTINPYKLYDSSGYSGHAVLLYNVEADQGVYHDSGPHNAQAGRKRPLNKFVEAGLDNGKMEGLIAIRKLEVAHA